MSINELMELVCENIPEDWAIRMTLLEGEAEISLVGPSAAEESSDDFCDDDLTTEMMVLQRLNYARDADGLNPVNLDGTPAIPGIDD